MSRSQKYRIRFAQCRADRLLLWLATAVVAHLALVVGLVAWQGWQTKGKASKPIDIHINASASPSPVVVDSAKPEPLTPTQVKRLNQLTPVGTASLPNVSSSNPTAPHKIMAVKPVPPIPQLKPTKPPTPIQRPSKKPPNPASVKKVTQKQPQVKAKPSAVPTPSSVPAPSRLKPKTGKTPTMPPTTPKVVLPPPPPQVPTFNDGQGLNEQPSPNEIATNTETVEAIRTQMRESYISAVRRRVMQFWAQYSQELPPDKPRQVMMKMVINPDGQLVGYAVMKSSDSQFADQAAIRAIQSAEPFDPLPPELTGTVIEIKMILEYNGSQQQHSTTP